MDREGDGEMSADDDIISTKKDTNGVIISPDLQDIYAAILTANRMLDGDLTTLKRELAIGALRALTKEAQKVIVKLEHERK
jgi:hypothetical protein